MVTQEPVYSLSIPGEATTEVSLNGLRAILGQVEAELYRSEIYEKVLCGLGHLPDDIGTQVQRMVKVVSREAIRLAFRKLVVKRHEEPEQPALVPSTQTSSAHHSSALQAQPTQYAALPSSPTGKLSQSSSEQGNSDIAGTVSKINAVAAAESKGIEPAIDRSTYVNSQSSAKQTKTKPRRRLTKKELAAQAARQDWETRLREIGHDIRQARLAKSWSLYHLHVRTQVPVHQLEALETGLIERLPEDIYTRGFIRQVGNALGLNGINLAASLPTVDPVKAILPTWYKPQLKAGLQLRSIHLYVGYAALMAGGLTWLSHQSAPKPSAKPSLIPDVASPSQSADSSQGSETKATNPGTINSSPKAGVSAPVGIAPPEMHPF